MTEIINFAREITELPSFAECVTSLWLTGKKINQIERVLLFLVFKLLEHI